MMSQVHTMVWLVCLSLIRMPERDRIQGDLNEAAPTNSYPVVAVDESGSGRLTTA